MRISSTPFLWGRPAPKWAPSGRAQSLVRSSQWVQGRNYSSIFTTHKTIPSEMPGTDTLRSTQIRGKHLQTEKVQQVATRMAEGLSAEIEDSGFMLPEEFPCMALRKGNRFSLDIN